MTTFEVTPATEPVVKPPANRTGQTIYHSHPHNKPNVRTHTLCFERFEDQLFCTWASPLKTAKYYDTVTGETIREPGDKFSRKLGVEIATGKMNKLKRQVPKICIPTAEYANDRKPQLFQYLPPVVADTLAWYIFKASKYFGPEVKGITILCRDTEERATISGTIEQYVEII